MKIQNPNWEKIKTGSILGIVFDMDGTLYTSESIIHQAYVEAVEKFNKEHGARLATPALNEILHQVGLPAKKIFENLFPGLSVDYRIMLNKYSLQNLCNSILKRGGRIFDDIEVMLKALNKKNIKLFVASNGRRPYISAILEGFDLAKYFQKLVTLGDDGVVTKAGIIQTYLRLCQWKSSQVLMVGDRTSDIEAARTADTWFAGVVWGHGPRDEIKDADIIVEQPLELISLFD